MKNFINLNQLSMSWKGKDKGTTNQRPDSVSLASRCRVLTKYVATLALFLTLGVGQMWG